MSLETDFDFKKAKRGPIIKSPGKTRITIMLDNDVIEHFRETAGNGPPGYQTLINQALREYLNGARLERTLQKSMRRIVREELRRAQA